VFGGYVRGAYAGDTWEWDGTAWTRATSTGPTARNSPALTYDAARRQIVLFGGDTRATGALGDTWVYDGTSWRQHSVAGPPPRSTHQMVYDSRRQRVVLFGGSAGTTMLGDPWEWDGVRWTLADTTGPSARNHVAMGYDASRGAVVLHGGGLGTVDPGETWTYDGKWTRTTASGPRRRYARLEFDTRANALLLYGGFDREPSNELWRLDGVNWKRVAP